MKNIAKCRLCHSVIESRHYCDYVTCSCNEIAIDGGNQNLFVYARNFENFMRIDENGNEILVSVKDKEAETEKTKPSREDLISMLDEMIASYERLPTHAQQSFVTNYDLSAALLLVSALLKAES